MSGKDRQRIRKLHALMVGGSSAAERENARSKLEALLKKLDRSWNDLIELLQFDQALSQPAVDSRDTGPHPFDQPDAPTPADTVRRMLELYVMLEPHEYVAVTLWIIHSHVFDKYEVTPRLLLSSPVRYCGKSTLLEVIERLVTRPDKSDSISAAAIYHALQGPPRTLLLDEADNLEMSAKAVLRAVLNAGHRRGGVVTRMVRGLPTRFPVFAPIALASIGTLSLSLPLLSRSIVIQMRRCDRQTWGSLRRFKETDTADLDVIYRHVVHWAKSVTLNLDPDMPAELYGRPADNWRPLLAVADACGAAWGALAREAAVAFARGQQDEDAAVLLLWHVRDVFNIRGVDRLASKELVCGLITLEGADAMWAEYRGPSGGERPRRLTQNALARLLRPFDIQPRTLWPSKRTADSHSRSARGYFHEDFEDAWSSYCGDGDTPPRSEAIKRLTLVE